MVSAHLHDNLNVMLADGATTHRYQDDPLWGDEDLFSLWIDEGLAVLPTMQQENLDQHFTTLTLGNSLAYKIYGPDGYLVANVFRLLEQEIAAFARS